MARKTSLLSRLLTWALVVSPLGCATVGPFEPYSLPAANPAVPEPSTTRSQLPSDEKRLPTEKPSESPFAGMNELPIDQLVEQVLARNPSLEKMQAAWQAATARYPQVISLDDPMFGSVLAPASIGSNDVTFGGRLEVTQKIPYPGKRALRGQSALAEARAAGHEVDDMGNQLIESAKLAYFDYYLVERALAVSDEGLKLLNEFRRDAESRYKTGQAPEQDMFLADVETGRQQERAITLARMRKVTIARINTLLNLPTDAPLPPPPAQMLSTVVLPPVETLRASALAQRPDLKTLNDRLEAEQASLALAYREYYPDMEASAAYDTIMGNGRSRDLAGQVGLRFNLPVRTSRRNAAVMEAHARVAQTRAELASRTNQTLLQVQETYEQLLESEKILNLCEKTLIPAAERNAKAAQSAYVSGKTPFLNLIEARRSVVGLRDRYYEAIADYHRRRANLDRVVGGAAVTP